MLWLKTLLNRIFHSKKNEIIDDIVILYDDVDMILYKKPVK